MYRIEVNCSFLLIRERIKRREGRKGKERKGREKERKFIRKEKKKERNIER